MSLFSHVVKKHGPKEEGPAKIQERTHPDPNPAHVKNPIQERIGMPTYKIGGGPKNLSAKFLLQPQAQAQAQAPAQAPAQARLSLSYCKFLFGFIFSERG